MSITELFAESAPAPADLTVEGAARAAAWALGRGLDELKSGRRNKQNVCDRWLLILILDAWAMLSPNSTELGGTLGMDPSTVTNALAKGKIKLVQERGFAARYDDAWAKLSIKLDKSYFGVAEKVVKNNLNWLPEDDAALQREWQPGLPAPAIDELAKKLGRTRGAIKNRIEHLARDDEPSRPGDFDEPLDRRCVGCGEIFETQKINELACRKCRFSALPRYGDRC